MVWEALEAIPFGALLSLITIDGESNWLEGALLMLVYAILAISFFEFVGPLG
jgi:Ca2+/H+ antiporter